MKNNGNKTKVSNVLSYLLRHDKTYKFETGGWRSVENLVQDKGFTIEQLCDFVANDPKGRFEFNDNKTKIRALYGHSIPVEMDYTECTPPNILYHGTSMNAQASILDNGLVSRSRNYVHLTSNNDAALETGARHGAPISIQIKAFEMFQNGYKFYNPVGEIWLAREVPRKFVDSYNIPIESFNTKGTEYKPIKIVCDSDNIFNELRKDSRRSSLCEIVQLKDTPLYVQTMQDLFNNQLYIFVFTNQNEINNKFVQDISNFKKYTYGIISISPVIVDNIPSIQIANQEEIHYILNILTLLIGRNQLYGLSFREIATFLASFGGEIKILQTIYNDSYHIDNICEELSATLKNQNSTFQNCIIELSMPDNYQNDLENITSKLYEIETFIHKLRPKINCSLCYSERFPEEKECYISLFLH